MHTVVRAVTPGSLSYFHAVYATYAMRLNAAGFIMPVPFYAPNAVGQGRCGMCLVAFL